MKSKEEMRGGSGLTDREGDDDRAWAKGWSRDKQRVSDGEELIIG